MIFSTKLSSSEEEEINSLTDLSDFLDIWLFSRGNIGSFNKREKKRNKYKKSLQNCLQVWIR